MITQAYNRYVKVSPRKVRLVADTIRKLDIKKAQDILRLTRKVGALPILKTLNSAIANAGNNLKLDKTKLRIKEIMVNEAGAFKRFHPAGRGRVRPYKKRMSHIKIALEEINGTKS